MTPRTFIIDGQVLQTNAWSRGMGRYLLALLGGIKSQEEDTRVILVLSSLLEFDDSKRAAVSNIYPDIELCTLEFVTGLGDAVEKHNTKILDSFVSKNNLAGATFLQTSLFSFNFQPAYPTKTINTCIFYDMIPLKFWDIFNLYFPEHEYFSRFKYVYSADKVFAISESVKSDLVNYLGFSKDDIVNISGADIPDFSEDQESYGDEKKFKYILLPGGDSPHKNMLRAIRGFDLFNAKFGDTYRLLITSFYSEENQQRMKSLSPNIELTGEISDDELHALYKGAEMILFPSLDEGLGLPVLEAVRYGKKVACSSIGIFKELSKDAFYFFDPYNPDDIARAILTGIIDYDDDERLKKYKVVQKNFTWARSARTLLNASIKKISIVQDDRHSIIVEQDDSAALRYQMGVLVRRLYRSRRIDLFIDVKSSYKSSINPLIFSTFLHTRDVADAVTKADKDSRTLVFTEKSIYTPALFRTGDEVLYINTDRKTVANNFKKQFGGTE